MNKYFTVILISIVAWSCKNTDSDPYVYIPNVPVNITINMDLPLHYHLQTLGAYSLVKGGSRGIFLVHNFDDNFYALERTCAYLPEKDCSIIQIDSALIQLRCGTYKDTFVECCTSKYGFDGNVIEGPSIYPLKKYRVFKNGNVLTIKN